MMKKYYDPIILDLDGNGVGRVSKFGMLFVMNGGGAMFDHDGDGVINADDEIFNRLKLK